MTTSEIKNLLNQCRVKGGLSNLVSMGDFKGSFYLNNENLETFYNLYNPTLYNSFGLAEKPQTYQQVRVDIDIKRLKQPNLTHRSSYHITQLISIYQQLFKSVIHNITDKELTCVFLDKQPYDITDNSNKIYEKNGFHLQFPFLFISKLNLDTIITPRVKSEVDKINLFQDLGFEVSSKLIDDISSTPWLFYGCIKAPTMSSYSISSIYNHLGEEISLLDTFKHYPLYDYKEKLIPLNSSEDITKNLHRILSTIPYNRETKDIIDTIKIVKSQEYKTKRELKHLDDETIQKNIKTASELIKLISPSRSVDRIDWLKIGWCLFNISQGSQGGFELWDTFSQLCEDKYDPCACEHQWSTMSLGSLSLGTLHYYAKEDNPKEYAEWIYDKNKDNIYACMKGSHKNLAIVFMDNFGIQNVRITSQKNLTSYIWNNEEKLWLEYGKESLFKIVSDILEPIIKKLCNEYYKKAQQAEKGTSEETLANARLKQAYELLNLINSAPYILNILKFISGYDIIKDFETKIINKSPHELPISGGLVIDLKTLETRTRTIDDFWSFELSVSYNKNTDLSVVDKFFKDITCNSIELQDYMRRFSGYLMTGGIEDRSLHILYGDGCNGKSSYINILKKITGKFSTSLSEDFNIKKTSKGASPDLMDLLYARCACLPESGKKEELNDKRVKTIAGDDRIKARHLFGDYVEFDTQAKLIWATNHKPKIDVDDKAIRDRLKLIPFLGSFQKTAENTKYIKGLQEHHLDNFFTYFCSGAYDYLNGDELIPTQEMNDAMNQYIQENDVVGEFIKDTYEIVSKDRYEILPKLEKDRNRTKKSIVYINFLQWIQENERKEDTLGKKDFNTKFSKKCDSIRVKIDYFLCKSINQENEPNTEDNDICNPLC